MRNPIVESGFGCATKFASSELVAVVVHTWPQVASTLRSYLETSAPDFTVPTR